MHTLFNSLLLIPVICLSGFSLAQDPGHVVSIIAKGTGQTTGHIATLSVHNTGNHPITTVAQTCFIPTDGYHQSYVGRIPGGITIAPGEQTDIPVSGFCADVHKPPVPSQENMPPVGEWIPVRHNHIEPPDPVNPGMLIQSEPNDPFEAHAIPEIIRSKGFKSESESVSSVIPTWPGTDVRIGGTFDPSADPRTFAPVVVSVLEEIEEAAVIVQSIPANTTPFGSDDERERETLIQQTFWITMGVMTGEPYEKEDFAVVTYSQFQDRTGTPVSKLPEADREKLDSGIDQFWGAFMATGIEAKVLADDDQGAVLIGFTKCQCDSMSVAYTITKNDTTYTGTMMTDFTEKDVYPYTDGYFVLRPGDELTLIIGEVHLYCSCPDSTKTESTCDKIYRSKISWRSSTDEMGSTLRDEGEYEIQWRESQNVEHEAIDRSDDSSVLLKFYDEYGSEQETYQRFRISAYCTDEKCGGPKETANAKFCRREFKLSFTNM